MKRSRLIVLVCLLSVACLPAWSWAEEPSAEGAPAPTLETPAAPASGEETVLFGDNEPEFMTLAYCSATIYCDNGSTIFCECTSGICHKYGGNPNGGSVECQCHNGTIRKDCPFPTVSCNRKACDLQCGGPGMGRCTAQGCVCI